MEIPFLGKNLSKQLEVPKPKSSGDATEIQSTNPNVTGTHNQTSNLPKPGLPQNRGPKILTIVLIVIVTLGGGALAFASTF